jgi:DNA helicase II / ATP-dependent DNA helicase PcrA
MTDTEHLADVVTEHRVIGPPGTGKTSYVSRQVAVAAGKYGPSGVAIASLTKAAAKEIGARTPGIPDENVGTLHAHAFRALGRPALAETPEGLKAWNEHIESRGPALRIGRGAALDPENAPPEALSSAATEGETLLQDLQRRRALMEPEEDWPPRLRRFNETWQQWKDDTNRLDFTDLVERCADLAEADAGPPDEEDAFLGSDARTNREGGLPSAPAVLFVDEAQDLSRVEFRLVRAWARQVEQLVAVGDPFQNLYEWRGSSPDAFAGGQVASETILAQSYRVPAAVHAYAVAWASRIKTMPFPEYHPTEVPGTVEATAATWARPAMLMAKVQADLAAGKRVMVLASCGYMLDPLCRLLKEHGLPFANPYRPNDGRWNPLRGAARLLAFLRMNADTYPGESGMWTWDEIRRWTEPMLAKDLFVYGAKSMIELAAEPDRFGEDPPLPTALKIARLFESDDDAYKAFDCDVDWWEQHLRATFARQMKYPCAVYRTLGPQALRNSPQPVNPGEEGWEGLIVGTVHSVKGGQADVVYVFPDLSRQAYWTGWQNPATRDPVIRMFYVAFTRARDRLVICDPAGADYAHLPRPAGAPARPAGHERAHRRLADEIRRRAIPNASLRSEQEPGPTEGEQK